jgi:hypothetical protein
MSDISIAAVSGSSAALSKKDLQVVADTVPDRKMNNKTRRCIKPYNGLAHGHQVPGGKLALCKIHDRDRPVAREAIC